VNPLLKKVNLDKLFLWVNRIVSLPLAAICAYTAWDICCRMLRGQEEKSDALALTIFIVGGSACLAYFIVSWTSGITKKEQK
jgi:hypothetical protein